MSCRFRLYLALVAVLMFVICTAPVALAKQQQSSPTPQATPPQTPSDSPSTVNPNPNKQNQNDSASQPPTSVTPETTPRPVEARTISWGSLVFGLLIGGIAGFLLGRQPGNTNIDVRRDRAA